MIKNITIYKAPVHRIYAENVKLVNGKIIPNIKSETIYDEQLFYNLYNSFVCLKIGCKLADITEATDFLYSSIENSKNKILNFIKNEKNEEFFDYLKMISACAYFDEREMVVDKKLSKLEFKNLKHSYQKKKK